MNKHVYFLLFIMAIIFLGCHSRVEKIVKQYNSFPVVKSLHSSKISGIRNDFYTHMMGIKDSILVFCINENSPHFQIYKLPEFKFIGSFGIEGYGPTDISTPVFWGQFSSDKESCKMWFFQLELMRLTQIDLFDYLEDDESIPVKEIELPPEIDMSVNVISVNDSILVGTGYQAKGAFFIYNTSEESLRWKQFPLRYDEDIINDLFSETNLIDDYNLGIIKIKPDGTRFVKANIYRPTIDVYNAELEMVLTIENKAFEYPVLDKKRLSFVPETNIYYSNIFLSDTYIYALYYNCTQQAMNTNTCNSVEVHVFNWEGNPICNYLLNEGIHPSGSFVVDEMNNKIYTIFPKNSEHYYSQFDLNEN